MITRVVIFCGPPCSGKSYWAKKLNTTLRYISVDKINSAIIKNSDLPSRDIAYGAMHVAAGYLLSEKIPVLLDATYTRKTNRKQLVNLIKLFDSRVSLVQFHVDPLIAGERYLSRSGHTAQDLSYGGVISQAKSYPYYANGYVFEGNNSRFLYNIIAGHRLHSHELVEWENGGIE